MTGVERIAAERQRQITEKGYTQDHDAGHFWESIAAAGAAYALSSTGYGYNAVNVWPWEAPIKPKGALSDMVRAGALIAAAIDLYLDKNGGVDHDRTQ